jgi:transaldolase
MPSSTLQQLADHGQSVWIDFLSRSFVRDGDLAGLVRDGVVGVTSNPTIFQAAIAEGDAYDEEIRELIEQGTGDAKEIFWQLAAGDVREACDILAGVYDECDGKDGWVSLEVDPNLAHDARATISEAKRLHKLVGRSNVFIKIPATVAGLEAIEETIASGIPVNVTLIFSLERHRRVAEAYLQGLRRLIDSGGDAGSVASVASFFVSRVDTETDSRLDQLGGHDELKGTLAIANAKLAYQTYKQTFSGPAWQELADTGASPQRCLWASTSTKNPAYRDIVYVEELVGPDTVDTMPRETVEATLDHGEIRNSLEQDISGAHTTLQAIADAGIDYDDVVETLEREGVAKFSKAFAELIQVIEEKLDSLVSV